MVVEEGQVKREEDACGEREAPLASRPRSLPALLPPGQHDKRRDGQQPRYVAAVDGETAAKMTRMPLKARHIAPATTASDDTPVPGVPGTRRVSRVRA